MFRADGWLIAVPVSQQVHLFRVSGADVVPVARLTGLDEGDGEINSVAFSPDGETLVAGDTRGILHFWDLRRLPK